MTKKAVRTNFKKAQRKSVLSLLSIPIPEELRSPPALDTCGFPAICAKVADLEKQIGQLNNKEKATDKEVINAAIIRALSHIATNAWRAKVKMLDAETGEAKQDMQRVYRHIEAIFENLKSLGIETIDPTGRAYDSGMALKVVGFEPTPGLSKEEIKETIKPSISMQNRLIQMGEVIVGTPAKANDSEREINEQNHR